jgi:phosphoglycerol geranylgeranyltransferase
MVYNTILSKEKPHKLAVLIDPDKSTVETVFKTLNICNKSNVDFLLIGGSLVSQPIDGFVAEVKKRTNLPLVLFPGSLFQISDNADAILLLSLISGRNPEYLIGNHVLAAPILKRSNLEIIPTGYILVNSGQVTSVQYISNTNPVPSDKPDIAVATAMAGEMLGHKLIYLEAGSGAQNCVPSDMIKAVKQNIQIPLIVGGGIRNRKQLTDIYDAGADIAVIGNSLENKPEILKDIICL